MRLLGFVLLIGLAGLLIGCGPSQEDPASTGNRTGGSGAKATNETPEKGPTGTPETKPEVKPGPPDVRPSVDPPEISPPVPTLKPDPTVGPVPDTTPPIIPPETSPPPGDPQNKKPTTPEKEDAKVQPVGGRAINLKSGDGGTTVSAGVGDLVIIELEANASTGFSWEAKPAEGDLILKLKSQRFETFSQLNPEIQSVPGQGGMTTFTYQVTDTGKSTIALVYRRPWEKDVEPAKTFGVEIEATKTTSPVVTGKIVFSEEPDVEKISRVVVSIRNTALADGPAPLIGTVELKPPFKLPVTFAVPYDPAKVQPNPMFYSISVRVSTIVDGSEKLYYINDTHHPIFQNADDTKCDVAVKKLR